MSFRIIGQKINIVKESHTFRFKARPTFDIQTTHG